MIETTNRKKQIFFTNISRLLTTVFYVTVMSGAVEHGTQYQITLAYEHKLQRTAYNFCFGPFGQVKGNRLSI